MRGRRFIADLGLGVVIGVSLVGLQPPARTSADNTCQGDFGFSVSGPRPAGPAMRFGIYPGGPAGQLILPASAKPESQSAIDAALGQLKPSGAPFVVHLYGAYTGTGSDAAEVLQAQQTLAHYTGLGFQVEYVIRYKPTAAGGDVPGYVAFVKDVVHRLGANPLVVGFQVTNEVNFTISGDSSDGTFTGAEAALIQGIEAGKAQALHDGYGQLSFGFNWFYRGDPNTEQSFWQYIHDNGGPQFIAALDWVGVDVYPGTFFPPAPGSEAGGIINALSVLRSCFLPIAGIPATTPMHIQENGWPTGSGRSPAMQDAALQTMIQAFDNLRRKQNVTDYRWFDLRDADSSSPNFQQQFGIMTDDYTPKPAFWSYKNLVAGLSQPATGQGSGGQPATVPGSGTSTTLPNTEAFPGPAIGGELVLGLTAVLWWLALACCWRQRR